MTEHHEEYGKCGEHHQCGDKSHQKCHEGHSGCDDKLMRLAEEAWMELLKDKIKTEIENKKGSDLQKLAEIVAKANGEKWKHKMAAKIGCEEYKNTLKDFFTSNK